MAGSEGGGVVEARARGRGGRVEPVVVEEPEAASGCRGELRGVRADTRGRIEADDEGDESEKDETKG
jgi:hypothetical protein